MTRYLTKSRFKLAMECPAKLFYTGKPEYANQKTENAFLEALADGGYQVGELAKAHFPGGHEIETLVSEEAIRQTEELLKLENVTIFEAAFSYSLLFIRADIVIKAGNNLQLIEVKSKSSDESGSESMTSKSGKISSGWLPYVQDLAFQKYVIRESHPNLNVTASIMTVDKSTVCPSDGLNQKFRITRAQSGWKKVVLTRPLTQEELSNSILRQDNLDKLCEQVYFDRYELPEVTTGFASMAQRYAEYYSSDVRAEVKPSTSCACCEFKATDEDLAAGLKSGFFECWHDALGWEMEDIQEPNMFDIWNCKKKAKFLEMGKFKLKDIEQSDICPTCDNKLGISASERQWLQIEKSQNQDTSVWVDRGNLANEMDSWVYPLHFIDFETAMVAIPFNKGKHPFEAIAFQFSHHIVYQDGRIEHAGQYLNTEPGVFPNFGFVRALKRNLENDNGSIFRYSPHENTYLRKIRDQIIENAAIVPDHLELCRFIDSITQADESIGSRNMIDMWVLVKRYYYDPAMKGSNSIKKVLPAILNNSEFLKQKYSRPIYGSPDGISSLNYHNKTWVEIEDGHVRDPYKLLRKMFQDMPEDELELLTVIDSINEGGAAMSAYARLQSEDMFDYERKEIRQSLFEYCELDTLAMVMIYEGWQELLGRILE